MIKYSIYAYIFAENMWVVLQKLLTFIFQKKIPRDLDILLTRTVNILTTNEFVKLMILWKTGPRNVKIWYTQRT